VGSADRRPDPEPPPRGSRRRPASSDPELPDRPDLRAGNDRTWPGVSRVPSRTRPAGPDTGTALHRRSASPRRDRPEGALAGPRRRPTRSAQRWDLDQQRLDRPPRHVRGRAFPAGRRHRGGDRSNPARPRSAEGGPAEGGPSRQPDFVDRRLPRRPQAAGRDRLSGSREPLWPPCARDAGPDRGSWRAALSDRSKWHG
jgi:hypothetical protein